MTTTVERPAATGIASWVRAQRNVVLGLAGVTVLAEVISLAAAFGQPVGGLTLSASLVPSVVLLLALGSRSNGRVVDAARLVPFWLGVGGTYLFGWALWSRRGDSLDVVALALAAINEEVVYRFAVPLLLTTGLLLLRVPPSAARWLGYIVAGAWWVVLPGHRAQTDSPTALLSFVALAAVTAVVVSRSRALLPTGLAHGALNIVTLSQFHGDIGPEARGVLAAALILLLVGTYAWPGDDEARARRQASAAEGTIDDLIGDVVIDLRDDVRPSVTRDGAVTFLDGEPDQPSTESATPVSPPSGRR